MPVWPKSKHIADISDAMADLHEWFNDDRSMPEPDSVRQVLAEIERLNGALQAVLVPTNFISLEAARDYISEILGVGIYANPQTKDVQ